MSSQMMNRETERPPRKRRVGLVIVLVLVLILGIGVANRLGLFAGGGSASAAGAPGEMPPMPVDVDTARVQPMADALRATGRIEAVQSIDLMPDEGGRITEILFREGQTVAAGTALIRIDDAMLRAEAAQAEADRDLARQQLERVRRLHADNASSPADLERAEATARGADAAFDLLQLRIDRATVRAPFAGVVGQRLISMGDYVTTATPLLTLQTVDPQRVVLDVSERHAGELSPGQAVEFTVAAQPDRVFQAEVEFIDPVVQEANRMIVVKARAPNRDRLLKPGMFIDARLATEMRNNAVVVSEDAIQPLRTANVVWAVVDGKASRRVVELGARRPGVVEILSGVEAGEVVVVGGLERMAEGMPLMPRSRVTGTAPDTAS